jgi:signal transduction histidine kinase
VADTELHSKYLFSNDKGKSHIDIAKLMFCEAQEKEENKNNNNKSLLAEVDRSLLSQVVFNLFDNAYKFTKENDTISVTLGKGLIKDKRSAIINIKDTGKGIDSEIMPKLFTRFATKSYKGTGLGLYICKSIVESHGGSIWAQNNEDGKGATFSFTIPLINDKKD